MLGGDDAADAAKAAEEAKAAADAAAAKVVEKEEEEEEAEADPEKTLNGGRRMTRKQRSAIKKVARALKAANKKAFSLAMTLKKKLRR